MCSLSHLSVWYSPILMERMVFFFIRSTKTPSWNERFFLCPFYMEFGYLFPRVQKNAFFFRQSMSTVCFHKPANCFRFSGAFSSTGVCCYTYCAYNLYRIDFTVVKKKINPILSMIYYTLARSDARKKLVL